MARLKTFKRIRQEDKITYGDKIVDGIVSLAISEIPFVEFYYPVYITPKKSSKAIKVSFDKDMVSVDVIVKVHYSQSVTDTAFKIQEVIRHSVESMTEYQINNVNVIVKGVIFDEIITDKPEVKNDDVEAELNEKNDSSNK